MAVPEEGLGPGWPPEHGAGIRAEIARLDEFAAALDADVRDHYLPEMLRLHQDMSAELPRPLGSFPELTSFLQAHQATAQDTSDVVYTVADATGGFAYAARRVSERYAETDAFAAARVADVEAALDETKAARPPRDPAGGTAAGRGPEAH
jgi:hypothetical protein